MRRPSTWSPSTPPRGHWKTGVWSVSQQLSLIEFVQPASSERHHRHLSVATVVTQYDVLTADARPRTRDSTFLAVDFLARVCVVGAEVQCTSIALSSSSSQCHCRLVDRQSKVVEHSSCPTCRSQLPADWLRRYSLKPVGTQRAWPLSASLLLLGRHDVANNR